MQRFVHQIKLLGNVTELGQYFFTRLSQKGFKTQGHRPRQEIRHRIEVKDEDYASEIGDACREHGLLASAEEDVIMIFPAPSIGHATAQRGLDIFEKRLYPTRQS